MAHEATEVPHQQMIAQSTRGFISLGTPHQGSRFAVFAILLTHFRYWLGSRMELLENLNPTSNELEDLHNAFLNSFPKLAIVNFFETLPKRVWGLLSFMVSPVFRILPQLMSTKVVTRKSASMEGRTNIALDCDHRSLNKYESCNSQNFSLVIHAILRVLQTIEPKGKLCSTLGRIC